MREEDLRRLAEVARLAYETKARRLQQIARELDTLQREADDLRQRRAALSKDLELDAARLSGADILWNRWVEERLTALQLRRAALAAERETELGRVRQAFGRHHVIARLAERGG